MNRKQREYIARLERRAAWLRSQSESTPDRTDISHTRAELSALDWAIRVLNGLNDNLRLSDEDNKEKMMIEHQHILKQYDGQSVDSVYWYCDKCGIEFIESRVEDKDE